MEVCLPAQCQASRRRLRDPCCLKLGSPGGSGFFLQESMLSRSFPPQSAGSRARSSGLPSVPSPGSGGHSPVLPDPRGCQAGPGLGMLRARSSGGAVAAGEEEGAAAAAAVRSRPGRSCAVFSLRRQDSRRAAVPTSCRPLSPVPPPPAPSPLLPPRGRGRFRDAHPWDTDPRCKADPQPLAPKRIH